MKQIKFDELAFGFTVGAFGRRHGKQRHEIEEGVQDDDAKRDMRKPLGLHVFMAERQNEHKNSSSNL